MKTELYPLSPKIENKKFFEPSANFRTAATAVVMSIVFFFIFYIFLILLAGNIMMGCGWLGITIIALKPGFVTLAAGAGIIALGVMFFIFFKFIFAKPKYENPFRIQFFETDVSLGIILKI